MRYIPTTSQDLEAWSVAVVVEFSQRSNCFKLPDTDSIVLTKLSSVTELGIFLIDSFLFIYRHCALSQEFSSIYDILS